jgi:hypothetical protein
MCRGELERGRSREESASYRMKRVLPGDTNLTSSSDTVTAARTSYILDVLRGQKNMETVSLNSRALTELQAEIVGLEETILDPATRDRLLDMPKKLFTEAQEYLRKGNVVEARLTLNSTCRLVERAKRELQEVELTTTCSNSPGSARQKLR